MSILSLQNVAFDYGREPLLDQASLNLQRGVKYALVGENGAGKSTLLSILAGELEPREGTIERTGGLSLDFLRQETTINQDSTRDLYTRTSEDAFSEILQLEIELSRIGAAIERNDQDAAALGEDLGKLQQDFERLGGYTWRSRLEGALSGLGLGPDTWPKLPRELSGGQRRRAALAAALLRDSDLLLLDEPTNHLDLKAREWLESRLGQLGAAVIMVSHDRFFLDRACTKTLHLERGKVRSYSGNYSFYLRASRETHRHQEKAWKRQEDKTARTEDFIRRNLAGQKTKQAQSRRRQLEKEEVLQRPGASGSAPRIRLEPRRQSGAMAIEATDLGKSYGAETLIRDFSLLIGRRERIGIIGSNGCGKTTLLRILAGSLLPDTGIVKWGHNVDLGFYDQQLLNVTDSHTVIEEISSVWPTATIGELRSFAGAFGFGADMIDRHVGLLSGGERGRLSLMRLVKEGYNTLLLDEPTNHLDMRSRESLEEALQEYSGTLVVISHDRQFLDRVIDKLLVFPDAPAGGSIPEIFVGNYSEWARHRAEAADAGKKRSAPSTVRRSTEGEDSSAKAGLSKNEIRRRQRLIAEAEADIASMEDRHAELLERLGSPDLDPGDRLKVSREIASLTEEMGEKIADWEAWNDEIESI